MAARNPTDWTRYLDERRFVAAKPIVESEIDKAYNGQVYTLDAPQLAISDCWYRASISDTDAFGTAGGDNGQLIRHYYVNAKDMCSVDGVDTEDGIPCAVFVRAWVVGATTGQVRITSGAAADETDTIDVTNTDPEWLPLADINIRTNNTEEVFILEGRLDAGSGPLYVDGLLIVVKET